MENNKTRKIQILGGYQQSDRFTVAVAEPDVYLYVPGAKDLTNLASTDILPLVGTVEQLDLLAEVKREISLYFWIEIAGRRYKLGRDLKVGPEIGLINLLETIASDKKLFVGQGNKLGVSLVSLRQLETDEVITIVGCAVEQQQGELSESNGGISLEALENLPSNSLLIGQGADGLDFLLPDLEEGILTSVLGEWILTEPSKTSYLLLQDRKPTGTNGGTFSRNAWRIRDVNTIASDDDNLAVVEGNQIFLAPGRYWFKISCPAYDVGNHQARLFDFTNQRTIEIGSSEYSDTNRPSTTRSLILGQFSTGNPVTLEIQHRCNSNKSNQGFGRACNFGEDEVYTIAEFWRD